MTLISRKLLGPDLVLVLAPLDTIGQDGVGMDAVVPEECDHPSRGQDGPAQDSCQDVGSSGLLLQHFEAQVSLAILALGLPAGADSQETEKCHPGTRPVVTAQGTITGKNSSVEFWQNEEEHRPGHFNWLESVPVAC